MKLPAKIGFGVVIILFILFLLMLVVARNQALSLVYNPLSERPSLSESPADFGLEYEDVTVVSSDGFELHAWYIRSQNGASILLQHGYKSNRIELLEEAKALVDNGYGVLLSSIRSHDENEGELIAFGLQEMPDLQAWFNFLVEQEDVDSEKIGILGNSLGGSLALQYAAQNEKIKAVVAHSAFSSMADTISTSVTYYTNLPAFPFASLISFWAEQEVNGKIDDIDASTWIGKISPRPVLILHSLSDVVISTGSGELLYSAAREPKELWQVEQVRHASFDTQLASEFETRVVGFFNQYLL